MHGVAAKFAIEVLVHFEQRHADSPASEEQREHRPAGASPNDAANGFGGRGLVHQHGQFIAFSEARLPTLERWATLRREL